MLRRAMALPLVLYYLLERGDLPLNMAPFKTYLGIFFFFILKRKSNAITQFAYAAILLVTQ